MEIKGILALSFGALISFGTAIAHLSCIHFGPACYEAQMAPPQIVQSANEDTMLAPIATIFVSSLFLLCGLFAISGAGFIKRLPFLELALISISVLCVLRGLATIPTSFIFPELVSVLSIASGIVWFFTGLLFFYGYKCFRQANPNRV